MKRFHSLFVVVLAACSACASSSSSPLLHPLVATPDDAIPRAAPATSVPPAEVPWPEAQVRRLANGMTFVGAPMPGNPNVAVILRMYGAGESGAVERTGLASTTAMMLRRGSRTDAGGVEWPIYATRAEAYYSWAREYAQINARSESAQVVPLIAALGREAQHPAFDPRALDIERRFVVEMQRRSLTPSATGDLALGRAIFGPTSPMARSTHGEEAFIARLSIPEITQFHAEHYVPERCVIVVTGGFDVDAAYAAVEAAFGGWASHRSPAPVFDPPFAEAIPEFEIIDDARDHALIHFAVPYELSTREERGAFNMLSLLYGGVFDSWLNLGLRERDGSAYSAGAEPLGTRRRGALVTEIVVAIDQVEPVVATLREAASRLARGEVDEAELALARAQLTARWIQAFGSPESTAMIAAFAFEEANPFEALEAEHAFVMSTTPAALAEIAGRIFRPNDVTLVVTGPKREIERAVEAGWNAPATHP